MQSRAADDRRQHDVDLGQSSNADQSLGPDEQLTLGRQIGLLQTGGGLKVGGDDVLRAELVGLADQQFGVRKGRQSRGPEPSLARRNHFERATTDTTGRTEHGDVLGSG